jgi:predicted metal-dependent hydrolase
MDNQPPPERSEVRFGTTTIPYVVIRGRRRKTVAVAVDPRGRVELRAPADTPLERLDRIVHRKAAWIVERVRRSRDLPPPPSPRELVSGETLLYLGRQMRLKVENGDGAHGPRLIAGRLVVTAEAVLPPAERAARVRRQLVAWYRRHAEERIPERVEIWRQRTGLEPAGVLIRSQASRWGSCDAKGVLRFNWRIVQAPVRLVDYVAAHELAHLLHPGHTPDFWAALGRILPDYEARRGDLRRLGDRLVW